MEKAPAPGKARSFSGRSLLWAADCALLLAGGIGAILQPPHSDPFRVVSNLDHLLYPIETNAFERLPAIGRDLNDIHISHGGRHIWAAGDAGIIVNSGDGGRSWVQQHPPRPSHKVHQNRQLRTWIFYLHQPAPWRLLNHLDDPDALDLMTIADGL